MGDKEIERKGMDSRTTGGKEMKYNDEQWDYILHDTWYHNEYYDLMCSILQDENEKWIEKFELTEVELREIFKQIESYWKDKVMLAFERNKGKEVRGFTLKCTNCLELFPITIVHRENIDVKGHFCSKKCWDKGVEMTA